MYKVNINKKINHMDLIWEILGSNRTYKNGTFLSNAK